MKTFIAIAASIVLLASSANAQSAKPIEGTDGSLDFSQMSEREVAEFQAAQIHLLNRRLSNLDVGFLLSMQNLGALPKNVAVSLLETTLELDKIGFRSIVGAVPAESSQALEDFLSEKPRKR